MYEREELFLRPDGDFEFKPLSWFSCNGDRKVDGADFWTGNWFHDAQWQANFVRSTVAEHYSTEALQRVIREARNGKDFAGEVWGKLVSVIEGALGGGADALQAAQAQWFDGEQLMRGHVAVCRQAAGDLATLQRTLATGGQTCSFEGDEQAAQGPIDTLEMRRREDGTTFEFRLAGPLLPLLSELVEAVVAGRPAREAAALARREAAEREELARQEAARVRAEAERKRAAAERERLLQDLPRRRKMQRVIREALARAEGCSAVTACPSQAPEDCDAELMRFDPSRHKHRYSRFCDCEACWQYRGKNLARERVLHGEEEHKLCGGEDHWGAFVGFERCDVCGLKHDVFKRESEVGNEAGVGGTDEDEGICHCGPCTAVSEYADSDLPDPEDESPSEESCCESDDDDGFDDYYLGVGRGGLFSSDVNLREGPPVLTAARRGDVYAVRRLLKEVAEKSRDKAQEELRAASCPAPEQVGSKRRRENVEKREEKRRRQGPAAVLNALRAHGDTPLAAAVRGGHDTVVLELLLAGADPTLEGRLELPLQAAEERARAAVAELEAARKGELSRRRRRQLRDAAPEKEVAEELWCRASARDAVVAMLKAAKDCWPRASCAAAQQGAGGTFTNTPQDAEQLARAVRAADASATAAWQDRRAQDVAAIAEALRRSYSWSDYGSDGDCGFDDDYSYGFDYEN